MNGAYLHVALNHLPVVGLLFGFLLVLFALFKNTDESRRIALYLLVLVALTAIPAYLTGEPAEHIVEELAGVSKDAIEVHEEAALFSLIAIEIVGALSLIGLLLFRGARRISTVFFVIILILTGASVAAMARTANLGGHIRHPEIGGDPPRRTEMSKDAMLHFAATKASAFLCG